MQYSKNRENPRYGDLSSLLSTVPLVCTTYLSAAFTTQLPLCCCPACLHHILVPCTCRLPSPHSFFSAVLLVCTTYLSAAFTTQLPLCCTTCLCHIPVSHLYHTASCLLYRLFMPHTCQPPSPHSFLSAVLPVCATYLSAAITTQLPLCCTTCLCYIAVGCHHHTASSLLYCLFVPDTCQPPIPHSFLSAVPPVCARYLSAAITTQLPLCCTACLCYIPVGRHHHTASSLLYHLFVPHTCRLLSPHSFLSTVPFGYV